MTPIKPPLNYSIKIPLLFSMIVILLTSSLVMIYTTKKGTLEDYRQHINEVQNLQTIKIKNQIELSLQQIEKSVQLLVSLIENNFIDYNDPNEIRYHLLILANQNKNIANMTFADSQNNYYCGFRAEEVGVLFYAQADSSGIMNSYYIDTKFEALDTYESTKDFYATKRIWYSSAVKQESIVWYPSYKLFSSNAYAIGASLAVRINNKIIGVVAADFSLKGFSNALKKLQGERKGAIILLNETNNIIANSQSKSDVYQQFIKSNSKLLSEMKNNTLDSTENFIIQKNEIKLNNSNTFWLLNIVSKQEVLGIVESRIKNIILLTILILIITVVVIWLVSSYLLSPLTKLEKASLHLAKGHLDASLPTSRFREINNLSSAYDVMARKISSNLQSLEDKVAKRTDELKVLNSKLEKSSLTDELTRLGNRRYYNEQMEYLWKQDEDICLAIIDVDFFKLYNDSYGHLQGDKCLIKLAEIFQNTYKGRNIRIARIGGEEFSLIFVRHKTSEVSLLLEQLQKKVKYEDITHKSSPISSSVTISIGVTQRSTSDKEWQDLYSRADKALYQAKNNNRNSTVEVFDLL